jgi:hypothetical protein
MPEDVHPEATAIPAPEVELLAGTERRINRGMIVIGIAGTVFCLGWGGLRWGAGFAIGAALSALNFRWMKAAVSVIANAASGPLSQHTRNQTAEGSGAESPPGSPEEGSGSGAPSGSGPGRGQGQGIGAAARFVFRYALIGLVAYAIFISSFISLGAFFAGLFVFIAAILAEVARQIYGAFRSA